MVMTEVIRALYGAVWCFPFEKVLVTNWDVTDEPMDKITTKRIRVMHYEGEALTSLWYASDNERWAHIISFAGKALWDSVAVGKCRAS
jgi:hypothetical protein